MSRGAGLLADDAAQQDGDTGSRRGLLSRRLTALEWKPRPSVGKPPVPHWFSLLPITASWVFGIAGCFAQVQFLSMNHAVTAAHTANWWHVVGGLLPLQMTISLWTMFYRVRIILHATRRLDSTQAAADKAIAQGARFSCVEKVMWVLNAVFSFAFKFSEALIFW